MNRGLQFGPGEARHGGAREKVVIIIKRAHGLLDLEKLRIEKVASLP